jgi:hypothetical protein
MKHLIIFSIVLVVFSCKSDTNSSYKKAIDLYLRDSLRKSNILIDSITISKFDTVTEKSITSFIIGENTRIANYYTDRATINLDLAKLRLKQAKLYGILGSSTLLDISKDDIKDELENAKMYNDSSQMYFRIRDSLIKIINQKDSILPLYIVVYPIVYGTKDKVINFQDSTPVFFKNGKIIDDLKIKYDFISDN